MTGYQNYTLQTRLLLVISLTIIALLWVFIYVPFAHAGDPEDIIGPMNPEKLVCAEPRYNTPISDVEGGVVHGGVYDPTQADKELLEKACAELNRPDSEFVVIDIDGDTVDGPFIVTSLQLTKIEGFVYEFHPLDPENPTTSEWFAVPSKSVPVVAKGVTFEIQFGSDDNGYFYYYKTKFGEGPVVLDLRLPDDAHPVNPNVLIESTGLDETWTVFLGFYRGDIEPPNLDQLKTPDGNFLPFGNTTYNSIVGLDGKSALPGVGGVLPQQTSPFVMVLAAVILVALPAAGAVTFYKRR